MNLNGDPYNLQGGATPLQGSVPSLQAAANPQQATGIYGPPASTPAPVAPVRAVKPKAAATRPSIIQPVQPKQLNSIFEPYIGTRPSPSNPGILEYFRKDTNQALSQQNLFSFASQLGAGQISSFDQLHAPVNNSVRTQIYETAPAQDANQTLAETAGSANLSPDEVIKLLQQSNALTPEQLTDIQNSLGIPDATKAAFEPPQQNTVDFYNEAYNGAGLADVKRQILALNDKVNAARGQFTDAQGQINENPFLSEESRVGRVKRLQDKAEQQIGNLLDQQKQYQDLYQQGLNEVNNLVTRHASDFQTNQELNAAKLTYLTSKAEQQAAATIAEKNQQAYKYLPDYLKAKAKATAPGTVTTPNGALYSYDRNTGTFQQLSGPTGNFDVNPITGDLYSKNTGQGLGTSGGSISIPSNTLAFRNNNPGNLRFVGQAGASQGEGGFAKFATPDAGYAALQAQIALDAGRGLTLSAFINKYAPPSENNTSQYIQQAITALGATASTPISQIDPNALAQFMAKKESGTTVGGIPSGNSLQSTAQQLVDGLLSPTQISERTPGYQQILQYAQQYSQQKYGQPFDLQSAEQNYQAKQSALKQSATDFRTLQLANQTALDHLSQLESLSLAAKRSNSPAINTGIIYTKAHVQGDNNFTSYLSAIGVVRAEVAKVLGGGTTTVESLNEAKAVLPENLGHQGLMDAIKNVKELMASKIKEYGNLNNVAQYSGNPQPNQSSGSVNLSDLNFSF